MEDCSTCEKHSCEQACLRGRTSNPVKINYIASNLRKDKPQSRHDNLDLSIDFCGVHCLNPFFLASSPVAHNYEMCARAFEAGWGGICFKTISYIKVNEVSPRFDQVERNSMPFLGFKNMEQLSEETPEVNFSAIRKLKDNYPNHIIISSIMGRDDDEWTSLAKCSTEAGADIIECNFSCPQMSGEGMGSDVGQNGELVKQYTIATCKGTHLPVLAKMTPNIGNVEPVAKAAIDGGATGIAAINTIKSITRIDDEAYTALPVVSGKSSVSGYSGAAIRPIAYVLFKIWLQIHLLENIKLVELAALKLGEMH